MSFILSKKAMNTNSWPYLFFKKQIYFLLFKGIKSKAITPDTIPQIPERMDPLPSLSVALKPIFSSVFIVLLTPLISSWSLIKGNKQKHIIPPANKHKNDNRGKTYLTNPFLLTLGINEKTKYVTNRTIPITNKQNIAINPPF